LCVGLSIVAGRDLRAPWDIAWLGILCATSVVGVTLSFGLAGGAGYMIVYIAGSLLVGLYGRATRNAEAARERSDQLRGELEEANRRLRAYAEQVERAASAQERARLSRELHDAATQTVFSINLTAEAARLARTEDPERLPTLLDRLQELARDALGELRSLVHELRPPTIAEEGLVRALQRHAAMRERRDCVRVALSVEGQEGGGAAVKETLYSIAVEALNNVVKHAGVSEASLTVSFDTDGVTLSVRDAGAGFDASAPRATESFGLASMRERVEAIGGSLSVRTAPGKGTEVEARAPLAREEA
jgi:signal transduction histidine kinase